MYYIFIAIQNSPDIINSRGGGNIKMVLGFGEIIITLFSVIFLIYTNKFLIRNRDRELGLINMLGVDKKGISKIMVFENIFLTILNLIIGIGASILFSSVIFAAIGRYLSLKLTTNFYVDFTSIVKTIVVYLLIFLVVLIGNIIRVRRLKPLDLLKESEKGEREPKGSIVLTLLGVIFLVAGYYIANSFENVLEAMYMFFIAVILVIIGTYLLFTTVSIFILKILRKNKRIYYKSKNMTFISSLLFRMKQNAVSLANICILSTMVLVMLVSTTSLIFSKDYFMENILPSDITIEFIGLNKAKEDKIEKIVNDNIKNNNLEKKDLITTHSITIGANEKDEGVFDLAVTADSVMPSMTILTIYNIDEYNKVVGEDIKLNNGETLLYSNKGKEREQIALGDNTLKVKKNLSEVPTEFKNMKMDLFDTYTVILNKDSQIYNELSGTNVPEGFGGNLLGTNTSILFDLEGTKTESEKFTNDLRKDLLANYGGDGSNVSLTNKDEFAMEFVTMHSGIFIVTILLSVLFLVATIMIIYYKQISEGMEDAKNISILSKIGMSNREIKKNIEKQTRIVFFAPLVISIIHLVGASSIVYNILKVIGIGNIDVFYKAGLITVIAYIIVYIVVYEITSNSYYKMTKNSLK